MEEYLVFQFFKNIQNYLKIKQTKHIIFEKEKFRFKGDVSILKRYCGVNNIDQLLADSKQWSLPLAKTSSSDELTFHLFFDKPHAFKQCLIQVHEKQMMYGFSPKKMKILLKKDEAVKNSLTQMRINVAHKFVYNICSKFGYEVLTECNAKSTDISKLYFTNKSEGPEGYKRVCVMGVDIGKNLVETALEDYKKLKLEAVKSMSNEMVADCSNDLVDLCIKFDLFHGNLASSVRVINNGGDALLNIKDSIFLVYNYVRLKTILKTFETKVAENVYPELLPIEEVDLSLLNKEEEWSIVFDNILKFPQVLADFSSRLDEGRVQLHSLFNFLILFSNQLSRYYRRVRILTESKPHLIQVLFARIHLISACVVIYDVIFECLEIKPPTVM